MFTSLRTNQSLQLNKVVSKEERFNFYNYFLMMKLKKLVFKWALIKPWSDGFGASFFQQNYDVVHPLVCKSVKDFFMSGRFLKEIYHMIIGLISKTVYKITLKISYQPYAACSTRNYQSSSKSVHSSSKLFMIIFLLLMKFWINLSMWKAKNHTWPQNLIWRKLMVALNKIFFLSAFGSSVSMSKGYVVLRSVLLQCRTRYVLIIKHVSSLLRLEASLGRPFVTLFVSCLHWRLASKATLASFLAYKWDWY